MKLSKNQVNSAIVATIVTLLLIALGCGGGGGGGGGGGTSSTTASNGTTGTVTDVALYALYSGTQSPASVAISGAANQLALSVGDLIQFSYIGVSSTNNQDHVTVSGGALSTNAPASAAYLSGSVLHVVGTTGSNTYTVAGSYQGANFSYTFSVGVARAKVSGFVRDTNGLPVSNGLVKFYDGTALVAETTTGFTGTFLGSVPATADGFTLDLRAQQASYYNEYNYNGLNYTSAVTSCFTSLPKLTTNTTTTLPDQVVAYAFKIDSPPPAPTGCG
jgi:hypothetical protein